MSERLICLCWDVSHFFSRLRFMFGKTVSLSGYRRACGKLILLPLILAERKCAVSVSDRIQRSMEQGSWVRKMFDEGAGLKRQYGEENVFDLSLGNPVMEPPVEFRQELERLAENPPPGMHRYMENAGYPETRAAVATQLTLETGIRFNMNDIIMTCGAAGALNVVLKTILNQGDEVIIFAPSIPCFARLNISTEDVCGSMHIISGLFCGTQKTIFLKIAWACKRIFTLAFVFSIVHT